MKILLYNSAHIRIKSFQSIRSIDILFGGRLYYLVFFCISLNPLFAQEINDDVNKSLPRVFLDCDGCDFDFVRREIDFVHYVRDRKQADIHILVTDQNTASGGEAYNLNFIGLKQFESINYTLLYNGPATATDFEIDIGLSKKIKEGLVPFISETSLSDNILIDIQRESSSSSLRQLPVTDPWNYWVFEIELGGFIEKEERQSDLSVDVELSADRVTENWRIRNMTTMDPSSGAFHRIGPLAFLDQLSPIHSIISPWDSG